ncbi:unnamed protein product [Rotaria sp. Silwood1]|nr:unnamed protein product [Rotaria sp. Silwood1]
MIYNSWKSIINEISEESSGNFKYFRKTYRSVHYKQAVASGHLRATSAPPRYPPISRRNSFHEAEERRLIEDEINRDPRDAFYLTRREALLRKRGLVHDALNDLSLAIYIEPSFMDAYWQRELTYMIFEHYDEALDSLNMCIKLNKTHAGAYKLRVDIYSIKNDLALAIANYSQAIHYNPTDHEAYYQRAQTYERRNEILSAMDDYVQLD